MLFAVGFDEMLPFDANSTSASSMNIKEGPTYTQIKNFKICMS